MFCTKCGAQIPDDANFCINCGIENEYQIEQEWVFDENKIKINTNTLFFQQSEQKQEISLSEIMAVNKKIRIRVSCIIWAIILFVLLTNWHGAFDESFLGGIDSQIILVFVKVMIFFGLLGAIACIFCNRVIIRLKDGSDLKFDISWFDEDREKLNSLIEFFNNKKSNSKGV